MYDQLVPGKIYHINSRTIGNELLFRNAGNYAYFLRRYADFCSNHFATFCYCLLPNHFHLLVQVKESTNEAAALSAFSNFLNSYSKSYNKAFERHGGLFQRKFKRKQINTDSYLTEVIKYIHRNPQKHGLIQDFKKWNYSSYGTFFLKSNNQLETDWVLDWFGGVNEFEKNHLWEEDNHLDFRELEDL